ncbi:MAG: VirB3 family type IV secretion system protein [Hyphomicrobiales bacterium]|nr:VirB3 family type IV secretion system protein [Rickettsiales bacterium]MCP5361761.1 VirB3 family type IV secretion system protein [Hyphomicrobiales bacterium]
MQDLGRLEADPVFLALTRPAMIVGVTYAWFVLEALFWISIFINFRKFGLVIPGALITHAIGMLVTRQEPRFLDIYKVRFGLCNKCKNTKYHNNTQSFDLYK